MSHKEAYRASQAQLGVAETNLALLKAGAWDGDKLIAYTAVKQVQAQVEQDKTMLGLLQVRAPVDGIILQLNVRPGEYVAATPGQVLVMMGSLRPLHLRVNIDEEDIPRLRLGAPARAKLRGDARLEEIPMTFVRLEPYVMPKASLSEPTSSASIRAASSWSTPSTPTTSSCARRRCWWGRGCGIGVCAPFREGSRSRKCRVFLRWR